MDIKVDQKVVVCFDLDDTLYNEIDFLKSGFKAVAKSVDNNWKSLLTHMFSLFRYNEDAFDFISEKYKVEKKDLIALYRNHKPDITPFEGAKGLFQKIKKKEGVAAIITDGRSITQRNKLNSLGLTPYIDSLVISEEIGSEKPDKSNFLSIEKDHPDCKYFYIADNYLKDFISPNALGWQTIGLIDNGRNIHNHAFKYMEDARYKPQFLIEELSEIRIL